MARVDDDVFFVWVFVNLTCLSSNLGRGYSIMPQSRYLITEATIHARHTL